MTSAAPSFEEVALRLVEAADPAALQTFLLTKLHTLGPSDKAQVRTQHFGKAALVRAGKGACCIRVPNLNRKLATCGARPCSVCNQCKCRREGWQLLRSCLHT